MAELAVSSGECLSDSGIRTLNLYTLLAPINHFKMYYWYKYCRCIVPSHTSIQERLMTELKSMRSVAFDNWWKLVLWTRHPAYLLMISEDYGTWFLWPPVFRIRDILRRIRILGFDSTLVYGSGSCAYRQRFTRCCTEKFFFCYRFSCR